MGILIVLLVGLAVGLKRKARRIEISLTDSSQNTPYCYNPDLDLSVSIYHTYDDTPEPPTNLWEANDAEMLEEWYCFVPESKDNRGRFNEFNVGFVIGNDSNPFFWQTLPSYVDDAWDGVYEFLTTTGEVEAVSLFVDVTANDARS